MSKPIRVLHVVVNMNRGGAETLIMNLYRNIDRTKVQFDFLTCREGVFDNEIKELGGKIHRIPYINDVGPFGYIKALNDFFSNHNDYLIVHSHLNQMSGVVVRAAKKNGIKYCISHSHNTGGEGGIITKGYKWYSGLFIPLNSNYTFACSQAAAKWLFGKKADEAKLLNNGIEPEMFSFSPEIRLMKRKELGISDQLVIGHVGRFNKQKNHKFLVEVFAELVKRKPNSLLLLCGDGVLRQDIENRVNELNIRDKVKFLGIRSDIHQLLHAFDIFLFPSLHEGLPVTLIEAQAAGIPCLISDEITNEVDLGLGLMKFLSISNKDMWIAELNKFDAKKMDRNTPKIKKLREKGYDIKITAEWLQDFYLSNAR
ncbi:glycosyltransferase involved in cell wall biosynthesis [Neobacillus bataviensis]|uniref:Glycosyltransferase involved in cell wall biosynthesis n=1 Tax=Neobacillus bataviensis TaxID=220685 RepID=A0A561D621_9BACI|nr:glycosyltransferase family 1 protein [Neobacillus bataviensis]TWD98891.1 glycosyltransferase involved in cell wall biosynthesis [Neobacillus bataviensis]